MARTMKAFLMVFLAVVVSAGVAIAQHNHAAMTEQSQSTPSSEDMMKSCQKHGSETRAALDKLEKTIAAGRESSDPARMKAALDQAQAQLAEAKHHMSMCPMMSGSAMPQGSMQHMNHMNMKGMSNQQPESKDAGQTPQ